MRLSILTSYDLIRYNSETGTETGTATGTASYFRFTWNLFRDLICLFTITNMAACSKDYVVTVSL